ncbi:MAG: P-II family nitrogen regulator [Gammaproteobacteria bacterium]|nr:P-II family nitrogen regulator [Gammaproteobacteria bacterium]
MSDAADNKKHSDLDAITVIVQRGKAEPIVKAMMKAGATGATIYFARGTGVRERLGLLGIAIQPEKEVIIVVTPRAITDRVFDAVVKAGKLEHPGMGLAFTQEVGRVVGLIRSNDNDE